MCDYKRFSAQALVLAVTGLFASVSASRAETTTRVELNKRLIQVSFDRWRTGLGGPFEHLATNATWTITGNSLVARTYGSRDEFLNVVIKPFNARLTKPLVPSVRGLYAEGNTVVVLFDGEATARDGRPYRNAYAWFMEMREGEIVNVTAFFDSIAFDELWRRVSGGPE